MSALPGKPPAYGLERVAPERAFDGFRLRAAEVRRVRRELGVEIGDAARATHVPVGDLIRLEQGLLAFAAPAAYVVVLERIRGFATYRGKKAGPT
jgi:hypothetical protein